MKVGRCGRCDNARQSGSLLGVHLVEDLARQARAEFHNDSCRHSGPDEFKLLGCGIGTHVLVDFNQLSIGYTHEVFAFFEPVAVFDGTFFKQTDSLVDAGLKILQFLLLQKVTLVARRIGDVAAECTDLVFQTWRWRLLCERTG